MSGEPPALGPPVGAIGRGRAMVTSAIALTAAIAAGGIDLLHLGQPLLAEGRPRYDTVFLCRTALMALCAGATVYGIVGAAHGTRGPDGTGGRAPRSTRVLWTVLILNLLFVALFVADPLLYYTLGREDRPIENASALLLIAGAGLSLLAARALHRRRTDIRWAVPGCIALCVALLLVAMEEISWGQRLLQIQLPEFFRQHNQQQELNFHNVITGETENAYYFGTFLLLTGLPFVMRQRGHWARRPFWALFTPSLPLMVASAAPIAYSYDLWNITLTQFTFFATVLILLATARRERVVAPGIARWATVFAVTCVVTQGLHLAQGDRQSRIWDVTEYREFFIPLLLMLYAAEVLRRARSAAPEEWRESRLAGGVRQASASPALEAGREADFVAAQPRPD